MAGLGIPDNFSSDDEPPSKLHKHLVIISGCIFWIFALFLALALGSYNPSDPSFNTSTSQSPTNLLGYTGSYFSDFFIQGFGISSFLPVIVFSAWGWRIVRHHLLNGFIVRIIALICLIPVISAVISAIPLFIEPDMVIRWPSNSGIGGSIGLVLAKTAFAAAQDLMGKSGHILVWVLGLLFCVLLIPLCMGLSRQEWRRILGLFPFLFRILSENALLSQIITTILKWVRTHQPDLIRRLLILSELHIVKIKRYPLIRNLFVLRPEKSR